MQDRPQSRDQQKHSLAAEVLRKSGHLRLAAMGQSMLPTLWPGDLITVRATHFDEVAESVSETGYFGDLLGPDIRAHPPLNLAHLVSWRRSHAASPQSLGTMTPASAQSESPRRLTRVRVEIPLRLATLAPAPLFAEESHTLVVNPQGCGVKLSRALDPGTRVLLDGLPGGAQATARVANCLPLGTDGKSFLLGLALETIGNVWGIKSPPEDWGSDAAPVLAPVAAVEDPIKKKNWPYSLFSQKGEAHPGRR